MDRRVHLIITGRVQGVGYRAWFERASIAADLSGWVRNRRDGSVEAVLVGEDAAIEAIISTCWDDPPAARVTNVAVSPWPDVVPPGFGVHPTL